MSICSYSINPGTLMSDHKVDAQYLSVADICLEAFQVKKIKKKEKEKSLLVLTATSGNAKQPVVQLLSLSPSSEFRYDDAIPSLLASCTCASWMQARGGSYSVESEDAVPDCFSLNDQSVPSKFDTGCHAELNFRKAGWPELTNCMEHSP
jgi:hypothetical protein